MDMLAPMKRLFQLITLAALMLSLNSCGLPGALVRTAGSLVQGAGGLVAPAMAAGALL